MHFDASQCAYLLYTVDILFSTDAKRQGALQKVRSLLVKYDPVPVSPELKNYGDEGSREAKQYFLMDENVPAPMPCSQLAQPQAQQWVVRTHIG
jgi:FPC/CPF motif-containing protein YcgG